jgi:hypothetical protein
VQWRNLCVCESSIIKQVAFSKLLSQNHRVNSMGTGIIAMVSSKTMSTLQYRHQLKELMRGQTDRVWLHILGRSSRTPVILTARLTCLPQYPVQSSRNDFLNTPHKLSLRSQTIHNTTHINFSSEFQKRFHITTQYNETLHSEFKKSSDDNDLKDAHQVVCRLISHSLCARASTGRQPLSISFGCRLPVLRFFMSICGWSRWSDLSEQMQSFRVLHQHFANVLAVCQ